jgi:hypothetical protein
LFENQISLLEVADKLFRRSFMPVNAGMAGLMVG